VGLLGEDASSEADRNPAHLIETIRNYANEERDLPPPPDDVTL
jgi:hypothetical protein